MVTGVTKKTQVPIHPHVPGPGSVPGEFRVYRPTKNDVLCGRGKPIQEHAGNVRMRRIIAQHANRYTQASKYEHKHRVVEDIVRLVQNANGIPGRFLQRVGRENYWVVVPHSTALLKVSHGLRCLVRKGVSEGESFVDDDEDTTTSSSPGHYDHEKLSSYSSSASLQSSQALAVTPSPLSVTSTKSSLNARFPVCLLPGPPLLGSGATPSGLSPISDARLIDMFARQHLARELSLAAVNQRETFLLASRLAEYQANMEHQEKLAIALLSSAIMGGSMRAP